MKWLVGLLAALVLTGAASAAVGINVVPALITNNTGAALTNTPLPFSLSSQSLVNGSWMSATGLDTDVLQSGASVPYMPGTGQSRMLACFNNAGVDQTTACNNATAGDITLPATSSQVFEFAADNQFSHQWLNISTAAVATWTITWEYYNGVSFVALGSVVDGTNGFTTSGLHRVSWAFPTAGLWSSSALHGVTGYWVRARVSAFTSVTTPPLGQQAYYETGRWWVFSSAIAVAEQQRFDVQLDTNVNQPDVPYFPHDDGVSVADVAGLELGSSNFTVEVEGFFNTDAGSSKNIVFKQSSIEMTVSSTGSGTVNTRFYGAESFTIAATGNDAYILSTSDAVYANVVCDTGNATDTISQGVRSFSAGTYKIHVGVMRWDTSGIPDDATIISATVRLFITAKSDADARNFTMDWWDFGGAAACEDWVHDALSNAHSSTIVSVTAGAFNTFTLTNLSNISLTGVTGLRTHVDGAAPGGANEVYWTTYDGNPANAARLDVTYATTLLRATNVASGYHTITVQATGGITATLKVDGVVRDTIAYSLPLVNNANAWTMFVNEVMPYVTLARITVGGALRLWFQMNDLPDHQIDDRSGNSNNAVARYPDTPSLLTSRVLPLEPTGVTHGDVLAPSGAFVAPVSEITNLEATEHTNTPTFPVFVLLRWGADNSGGMIPYQAYLIMFAFILCVAAMLGSWYALHSVHITWIALTAASISFIFVGGGIWTWMIPFSFAITGAVYIFYRRGTV